MNALNALEHTGAGQNIFTRSEQHYTILEIATGKVKKFKSTGTDYLLTINPLSDGSSLMDQLAQIFDYMVGEMTENLSDNDLVCFVLQSGFPYYPFSPPLKPRHGLNAERIVTEEQCLLQSCKKVDLEAGMNVYLVHVGMPQGGVCANGNILVLSSPSSFTASEASFASKTKTTSFWLAHWLQIWLDKKRIRLTVRFVMSQNSTTPCPAIASDGWGSGKSLWSS